MFKEFFRYFKINETDGKNYQIENKLDKIENLALGFNELFSKWQGNSFGEGIYRLHHYEDIEKWNKIIVEAFPEYKQRMHCFGYDWLGRQFALDKKRIIDGEPQILMFEPGTGEVLEIPCNFIQFHNEEIPDYHEACLASEFFHKWTNTYKIKIKENECVGYRNLLFIGGEDVINNLEITNMEVYWSISGQLITKTKNLPNNTRIKIVNN